MALCTRCHDEVHKVEVGVGVGVGASYM
jgi:hypothetical protein